MYDRPKLGIYMYPQTRVDHYFHKEHDNLYMIGIAYFRTNPCEQRSNPAVLYHPFIYWSKIRIPIMGENHPQ
jgi:hypothetical protein